MTSAAVSLHDTVVIRILISFIIFLFITAVLFASKLTPKKNEVTNNRFIKVDRYGITLTSWQGPWACIFIKNSNFYGK